MSKLSAWWDSILDAIAAWVGNIWPLPPQPDPEPPQPEPEPNPDPPSGGAPNPDKPGDYRAGFLWKPVSENRDKLVVLIPKAFTGHSRKDGLLYSSSGIERGSYSGVANGDREHYRFSKAGGSYPSEVEFRVSCGQHLWCWRIPRPAERYDGKITPTVRSIDGPEPEPPAQPEEPEKPKHPTIAWNGTTEIRLNPDVGFHRLYIVTHTAKNGKKYDWRTGQYHKLIEMHKPVPSGNVIKIEKIFQIQEEGIIQVCCETTEMYKRDGTKYSWCWLLRPNKPAESFITYAEWQAGKEDGIVLPLGKDG